MWCISWNNIITKYTQPLSPAKVLKMNGILILKEMPWDTHCCHLEKTNNLYWVREAMAESAAYVPSSGLRDSRSCPANGCLSLRLSSDLNSPTCFDTNLSGLARGTIINTCADPTAACYRSPASHTRPYRRTRTPEKKCSNDQKIVIRILHYSDTVKQRYAVGLAGERKCGVEWVWCFLPTFMYTNYKSMGRLVGLETPPKRR